VVALYRGETVLALDAGEDQPSVGSGGEHEGRIAREGEADFV
jgi:hypothetical protein